MTDPVAESLSLALPGRAERALPASIRRAVCVAVLCLGDFVTILAATGVGFFEHQLLQRWVPLKSFSLYSWFESAAFIFGVVAVGFLVRGMYSRRETFWQTVRLTLTTCLGSVLLMIAALYLTKVAEATPRSLAILAGANLLLLAPPARLLVVALLRGAGLWCQRALVVGGREAARALARDLESDFALGYRVVAVGPLEADFGTPPDVDEVVITTAGQDPARVATFIAAAHRTCPSITVVPELGSLPFGAGTSQFLFDSGRILLTSRNLLKADGNLAIKRVFDLAAALVATLLATPALLLVALAIRLDSAGSAVYVQTRVGRGGRRLRMLKFRTMYVDAQERLERLLSADPEARAEWERHFKLKDDPRVTRLGSFLRRTSLDELPQLFNVIAGSMSLVGPRPLPDYHYEKLPEPYRSEYLDVKPGITGLWQVSGRSDTDVEGMGMLNSWYVRNWSLWLDVTIVLRTIPVVLLRKGAY